MRQDVCFQRPSKGHSGASECAPSVSLPCRSYRLPLGDPSRHGAETSHPPPVRTPARPIVPRLGLVCRASLHMAVLAATHPPDAVPVCLFSVGGCSWPCSSRRQETSRPVSLSLPPISFPLTSLPSEVRCCRRDLAFQESTSSPAVASRLAGHGSRLGPSILEIGVLSWLPFFPKERPPSPVPGPQPTPCLPRHRWADATLAGLRLSTLRSTLPAHATPAPPPSLLPHPPTTVPLYLVPPPAAAKRSLAHLMSFSCPQTQSGLCQEIRLSSYRRSELDRAEARCPPPASPRLGRRHYFPSFSLIPPGSCTAPPSGPLLLPSRRPTIKAALVVPPRHWKSLLSSEPAWPNTFPTLISVSGL